MDTRENGIAGKSRVLMMTRGEDWSAFADELAVYGVASETIVADADPIDLGARDLAGCLCVVYNPDAVSPGCLAAISASGLPALPSAGSSGSSEFRAFMANATPANLRAAARYALRRCLGRSDVAETGEAQRVPPFGIVDPDDEGVLYASLDEYEAQRKDLADMPVVGVLVHRSSYLSGKLAPYRLLATHLAGMGIAAIIAFMDGEAAPFHEVFDACFRRAEDMRCVLDVFVNATLFAIKAVGDLSSQETAALVYENLGIPVASPAVSHYSGRSDWQAKPDALGRDMPTAYMIPEMTGAIEGVLIATNKDQTAETIEENVLYLARRLAAHVNLAGKPNAQKKVAILLHNSVCKGVEASIGKAHGLNPFESCAMLIRALSQEGYDVGDAPTKGDDLKEAIMSHKAYSDFRWTSTSDIKAAGGVAHAMGIGEYLPFFEELSEKLQEDMVNTWGTAPGEAMVLDGEILITGLHFGNVFVAVQPKRGCYGPKCTGEVCKILHDPSCPPPHQYLASYRYIRRIFGADAIVEVGTDGSAEYLPGRNAGLTDNCWPRVVVDDTPIFYAWHAGAISEGLMVKRRLGAVTITHLPGALSPDANLVALYETVREYQDAVAQDNGQAGQLKEAILRAADVNDVVMRLLENEKDFDKAVWDLGGHLSAALDSPPSTPKHVLGQLNHGEEVAYRDLGNEMPVVGAELSNILAGLSGRFVPPSPGGQPDSGASDFLPTGRNLYGLDISRIPTPLAWERGQVLADELLSQFLSETGSYPEQVALNMISVDITRTSGEQLCQYLSLLGVKPTFTDTLQFKGLEVIAPNVLGRPRIDVAVRITGVLRDTWPFAIEMMDEAFQAVCFLDEEDSVNYPAAHVRATGNANRIFGDPPGAYGTGIDLALLASAWEDNGDLARIFLDNSAFIYGKGQAGVANPDALIDVSRRLSATSDVNSGADQNSHMASYSTETQGGWRILSEAARGEDDRRPIASFMQRNAPGKPILTQALNEYLNNSVSNTLLNDFFLEAAMREGYDGAGDIMELMQSVFGAQCLLEAFEDSVIDAVNRRILTDAEFSAWMAQVNPWAREESVRRMLELASRGKYRPAPDVAQALAQASLESEGDLEDTLMPDTDAQGSDVTIVTWREVDAIKEKYAKYGAYFPGSSSTGSGPDAGARSAQP